MATFRRLDEIECWVYARALSLRIWEVSKQGSFEKDYSLREQINRSSGSSMDNIAEGYGRGGNKEFVYFLSIARGSSEEVKSQLFRALDRKHICLNQFDPLFKLTVKTSVKINNLIEYLKSSNHKGQKFK